MQEELMFEELASPLKGKGKEKDIGKRRAYVRVVTSLGGGSLNLELFCEKVILAFMFTSLVRLFWSCTRRRRHVITSLCLHELESTIIACSIGWCQDSWYFSYTSFSIMTDVLIFGHFRSNQVTQPVRVQEVNRTGARHSAMNTI
jgi:hypothetical protein